MDRQIYRRALLLSAVPTLLCIIAARQAYLVHEHNLTSWKGGGFGMFASVPWIRNRVLAIVLLLDDGRSFEVSLGDVLGRRPTDTALQDRVRELIAYPTEERARQLARDVAEIPWEVPAVQSAAGTPGRGAPAAQREGGSQTRFANVTGVRIEVWAYRFYTQRDRLELMLLQKVTEYSGSGQ